MSEEGTQVEPKMMSVDVHGQTISLPEEKAKQMIASRDAQTSQFNELKSSIDSNNAAQKKAEDDAQHAEEKRLADEAASKGNIDQLNNFHASELAKKDSDIKNLSISQAIGQHEGIARSALPDITAALSADSTISYIDGNLLVKKADGTSQAFGDYLSGWLTERPHFTVAKQSPPSGGDGKPAPASDVPTMTRAEYESKSEKPLMAKQLASELASGKLKLTD